MEAETLTIQATVSNFILKAFNDVTRFVVIVAGRRTGKTYNAVIWLVLKLLRKPDSLGLWVDTTQQNLLNYVNIYFIKIFKYLFLNKYIQFNQQAHTLTFYNGSILHMRSAERPETLEGFEYDFAVINEAGIVFKKKQLWQAIQPMIKGKCQTKFIGSPKGKNFFAELADREKTQKDWKTYTFTAYESPYWNKDELEIIKQTEPNYIWSSQYMASFIDSYENAILNYDDIQYYDHLPDIQEAYIHVDTTHTAKETSDYFCMLCLGKTLENKVYVIDYVLTKELDPQAQARAVISFYQANQRFNIKKLTFDAVSNDGFGLWTRDMARQQSIFLPLEAKKYPNDKVSHFTSSAFPLFRSKSIYLPQNNRQNSLAIDQLLAFPTKDVNDDFVDGLSGACDNITQTVIDYEANTYF